MTIEKKLLGTNPVSGAIPPEAVSFDGTNDYLERTSDMTGNADSKTFTFSVWFYYIFENSTFWLYSSGNTGSVSRDFNIDIEPNTLRLRGGNDGGTLQAAFTNMGQMYKEGWNHLLISMNMASTANRKVYINDTVITPTYYDYVNTTLPFSSNVHRVGTYSYSNDYEKFKGRLAHMFLDHTYRDLSVTANRRLFITADGKPADSDTLAALNPILYLPMTSADTAGYNSGTGGNFTVNGVLATAQRGPNQDNCSASVFDGSSDYLDKALSLNTKQLTCSFTLQANGAIADHRLFDAADNHFRIYYGSTLQIRCTNAAAGIVFVGTIAAPTAGREVHVAFSFNNATSSYVFMVDGVSVTPLSITQVDDALVVNGDVDIGRRSNGSQYVNGSLGEFYLNNTYIDLATSNPFWDSGTSLPIPVRNVISNTGVTPLIALPMIGSDAGNNLGSGGDFTVNSGPYTGARGGSEFWARSASFNGSTGILSRSVSTLAGKTFSIFMGYKELLNTGVGQVALASFGGLTIKRNNSANYRLDLAAKNASSTTILSSYTADSFVDKNVWVGIFISCDMAAGVIYMYSTFAGATNMTTSTITNDSIDFSTGGFTIGDTGKIANQATTYFTTDYIDFSQEANRNKFVSQLGYPIDLTQQIEDGDISSPLVYMKYEDTASLGTNSGSAGVFTTNSGVTAGPDFTT